MVQRCVVGGCSNVKTEKVALHQYPSDASLWPAWDRFIRTTRKDFYKGHARTIVCILDHFNENDFENFVSVVKWQLGGSKSLFLKMTAIPSRRKRGLAMSAETVDQPTSGPAKKPRKTRALLAMKLQMARETISIKSTNQVQKPDPARHCGDFASADKNNEDNGCSSDKDMETKDSAAMHYNENSGRGQAKTVTGEPRYQVYYSKAREFARSNTDVRLGLQDKVRLKGCSGHSSDCDLLSNDHCLRNVLRKKRGDTALMHSVPTRRPYRTVSEERLGDEISSIMAHNCLNAYSNSGDRMTELADETTHAATNEENANHKRLCYDSNLPHHAFLRSYPSAIASDKWRDTARVKSDASFSENSHGSMDTLAQVYDEDYNSNDRGETNKCMDSLGRSVADKLRLYPSDSRSSVASTCIESAQLRMMSLCASPPASSCSGGSISEEDLKSSDIDL